MKKTIYIKLLNEGSIAYRPVNAIAYKENIYEIVSHEIYDPEDEEWEFLPGTLVIVEERNLNGLNVLIAIANVQSD